MGLEGREAATVLGHVAYAYYLKHRDVPFDVVDISELYEQALEFDPNNTFANTMYGHWIIFRDRDADRAAPHFEVALKDQAKREWVRGMQLTAHINMVRRGSGSDSPEMMKLRLALLSAACDMRANEEPLPEQEKCKEILLCYGKSYRGRGEFVEYHVEHLDPVTQLPMVRWLDESIKYQGLNLANQVRYVIARLTEATGGSDEANSMYRKLASDDTVNRELILRIDESIERITGETSTRLRQSREREH